MNGGDQEALTSPDASMWRGFYFFIGFVIIGGFAIQATSSFPGLQQYNKNSPLISELDLAFVGSEIIDIEYYDSDWEHSHIAIIENSIGERILLRPIRLRHGRCLTNRKNRNGNYQR